MESTSKINKDNISVVSLEEFSEEEHQIYLAALEQFRFHYLMRSKKNRQGDVTKAQEFMTPAFKVKNDQIEVISDVSSQTPKTSALIPSSTTRDVRECFDTLIGRVEEGDLLVIILIPKFPILNNMRS